MERVLEVYKSRHEDFAVAILTEMGAPISMTREEQAAVGVSHLEAMIDALKRFEFDKDNAEWRYADARADRGLWHDHAMELADQPDRSQGRPGAGSRLHNGVETV